MLWECCLENLLRWDGVIQPTLWESFPGISICCYEAHAGQFFAVIQSTMALRSVARATSLPNNNSGIDLVSMQDGTLILALNPVNGNWGKRYPLSLIASHDNGESWLPLLDLESDRGEYSYPAIISEGGVVHITYTWNRKISYIVDYKRYKALSVETDSAGILCLARRALSRRDGRNSHDLPGNILENVSSFVCNGETTPLLHAWQ